MLIRKTGLTLVNLNILLNFANISEVRKAYQHENKRILNSIAIMCPLFRPQVLLVHQLHSVEAASDVLNCKEIRIFTMSSISFPMQSV